MLIQINNSLIYYQAMLNVVFQLYFLPVYCVQLKYSVT